MWFSGSPSFRWGDFSECALNDCSGFNNEALVQLHNCNSLSIQDNVVDVFTNSALAFDIQFSNSIISNGNGITLDDTQTGFGVIGGLLSYFRENTLNNGAVGINLTGHPNNDLCMNTFSGSDIGILFDNSPNLTKNELIANDFSDNTNGISITQSPLGEQEHNGNCWDGSGAVADVQQSSRFLIDQSNNLQACLQRPVGASTEWFPNRPGNTKTDCSTLSDIDCGGYLAPCCTDPWPDCPDCDFFLENFGRPDLGNPVSIMQWLQAVIPWYNAYLAAVGGTWAIDVTQCVPASRIVPSVATLLNAINQQSQLEYKLYQASTLTMEEEAEIEELESQVKLKKAVIAGMGEGADDQTIAELANEMASLSGQITEVYNNYELRKITLATEVIDLADELPSGSAMIEAQNSVLRLRAKALLDINSYTNQDWSDLVIAAYACAYEVGAAVYYARNLYYLYGAGPHPLDYNDNCSPVEERARNTVESTQFKVHPNPVIDVLTLSSDFPIMVTNLTVYNLVGQKLKLSEINERNTAFEVDISRLTSGTYFIKVKTEENQHEQVYKFIKID